MGKLYVKIFLISSIPFGGAFFFLTLILGAPLTTALLVGAVSGILFGISMSQALASLHKRETSQLPKEAQKMHQERVIDVTMSYDESFEKCRRYLDSVNAEITKDDRLSGVLRGSTAWGLGGRLGIIFKSVFSVLMRRPTLSPRAAMEKYGKTWGEILEFNLRRVDNSKTRVKISSKPADFWTIIDYGKNYENVEAMENFLKDRYEK